MNLNGDIEGDTESPKFCLAIKDGRKRGIGMARIYNGTPHEISIIGADGIRFDQNIRKYVADSEVNVVMAIPSNGVLNADITTCEGEPIEGIPVYGKVLCGVDTLPEGYDVYIVSALFASAYRKITPSENRLYTIADPVYTPDGRTILGSRGIARAFYN